MIGHGLSAVWIVWPRVPALSFGTGTFGGKRPLFSAWGQSDATEARRLIDVCLDAGANLFDTADGYSGGAAEKVLGEAIRGRRDAVLIPTTTDCLWVTDHRIGLHHVRA